MAEDFSPVKLTLAQEQRQREKRWKQKLAKLQLTEKIFKHHALAPLYHPRLIDPSPLWREFVRQKQAFSFAATFKEDMHVFAVDVDESGQRRYFVTSYPQLRHTIFHWKGQEPPHFYEVIPEGAACHLYFDIEYSKEHNPESDGVQMVDTFIMCVCYYLKEMYNIHCDRKNVIDLDATTDLKFSRHLIFRIADTAFRDNMHAGCFVHHICTAIAIHVRNSASDQSSVTEKSKEDSNRVQPNQDVESCPKAKKQRLDHGHEEKNFLSHVDLKQLFVNNKDGEKVIFVDQGVYSRNRNFRLYRCAKKGKQNVFKLSESNQYKPTFKKNFKVSFEDQIFVDSIISNVSFNLKLRILDCEGEFVRRSVRLQTNPGQDANTESASTVNNSRKSGNVVEGFKHSPYPELDSFIRAQTNKDGIQGEIRRWTYFSQGELIVYDIHKNRWCANIGRQHKSNNIMILVDLKHGVFYQKCHDPVCKAQSFKSPDQEVPMEYLPTFYDDIDDEELLKALEQMDEKIQSERDNCHGDSDENFEDDLDDETLLRAAEAYEQQQENNK